MHIVGVFLLDTDQCSCISNSQILGLSWKMIQEEGSSSICSSPLQKFSMMSFSTSPGSPYPWPREMRSEERGLCLIHLLVACANHVASGNVESANMDLEYISHLASPVGDTMQRIAAYFSEALANRMLKGWPGLHKALNSTKIASVADEILVQKLFYEFCPFLKLSYVITNQAIMEMMEGEKVIHIIDLNCFQPVQWINLLQEMRARPEGPPHLRISGILEHIEVLDIVARRLNAEAEKLDIPFQFNPLVCKLENLDVEKLRVKTGEAVAISSVLQLHSLLAVDDEALWKYSPLFTHSPSAAHLRRVLQMNPQNLGDFLEKGGTNICNASPDSASSSPIPLAACPDMATFLNGLWGLSPKLMMVTEQESNQNGLIFMDRIMESLNFYAALFDCLDSTMPRTSIERQRIEKMLFGEEITNIVASEGLGRKQRHEKLEKWIPRLELAGFGKVPLSYHVMLRARRLLQSYNYDGYKIKEENGCFIICWQDRALFSVSAWRSIRCSR